MTGRPPFEYNPDAEVIVKVLRGNKPDRPAAGFSDQLWVLLIQTWLEEYESSQPTRPNAGIILEQLYYEEGAWIPTSRTSSM